MKIIVDIKNYTSTDYIQYMERGVEVDEPQNPKYVVGQLVAVKRDEGEGKLELAVVLGCIDEKFYGELRLDLCGMTSIDKIRPAYVNDFGKSHVTYRNEIYKECRGEKINAF